MKPKIFWDSRVLRIFLVLIEIFLVAQIDAYSTPFADQINKLDTPTTLVEITINYNYSDLILRSVFQKQSGEQEFKTAIIRNVVKKNQEYLYTVELEYYFHAEQELRIEFLSDKKLAVFEAPLAKIIAKSEPYDYDVYIDGVKCGDFKVFIEELSNCIETFALRFEGHNLNLNCHHSLVGSTDLFLRLLKANNNYSDRFSTIGETEPIQHTNKIVWNEIAITPDKLCIGPNRKLKIECFDKSSEEKLIGSSEMTFGQLIKGKSYKLSRKGELYGTKSAGTIKLKQFHTTDVGKSLVDCIQRNKIAFGVAIDFSDTNKDHTETDSLHHLSDDTLNEYEIVLESIGNVIRHYNDDKRYLALGFGAIPHDEETVSHRFLLSESVDSRNHEGIEQIMLNYRETVKTVRFSTPKYFAPIIEAIIETAKNPENEERYYVLLIIACGLNVDMTGTKEAAEEALQYSIIIIIVFVVDTNDLLNDLVAIISYRKQLPGNVLAVKFFVNKDKPAKEQEIELAKRVFPKLKNHILEYCRTQAPIVN